MTWTKRKYSLPNLILNGKLHFGRMHVRHMEYGRKSDKHATSGREMSD